MQRGECFTKAITPKEQAPHNQSPYHWHIIICYSFVIHLWFCCYSVVILLFISTTTTTISYSYASPRVIRPSRGVDLLHVQVSPVQLWTRLSTWTPLVCRSPPSKLKWRFTHVVNIVNTQTIFSVIPRSKSGSRAGILRDRHISGWFWNNWCNCLASFLHIGTDVVQDWEVRGFRKILQSLTVRPPNVLPLIVATTLGPASFTAGWCCALTDVSHTHKGL